MQLFSIFMVLQCHGENTLQLDDQQQLVSCSIIASLYIVSAAVGIYLFEFAVLYRYQRLLMVLKGTWSYRLLSFLRRTLIALAVLLVLIYVFIMAFFRYDSVLVLDAKTASELVVKVLFLGVLLLFGVLVLISDLFCSLKMMREVLLTSVMVAHAKRTEGGATFLAEIRSKLAAFIAGLSICAIATIADLFTGFYFVSQLLTVYGITSLYLLQFLKDIVDTARTFIAEVESTKNTSVPLSGVSHVEVGSLHL